MSLIDEVSPCAWASIYCDLRHPVETYIYAPRGKNPAEKQLCRFHGQAWPRKSESKEEAHERIRRATTKMTPKSEQRSWARPPRNRRPTKEVPLPDQPEG